MKTTSYRKFMALTMATAMVMSPMTAMAQEITDDPNNNIPPYTSPALEGDGTLKDYVNKNVFRIVLPTVSDISFQVDPQGLLGVKDSTKFNLGDGAVYFTNAGAAAVVEKSGTVSAVSIAGKNVEITGVEISGMAKDGTYTYDGSAWKNGEEVLNVTSIKDDQDQVVTPATSDTIEIDGYVAPQAAGDPSYSGTSDAIEITNKSSYSIDIGFTVNFTVPERVEVAQSKTAAQAATVPTIFLAMQETNDNDVIALAKGENKHEDVNVGEIPAYKEASGSDPVVEGYRLTHEVGAGGEDVFKYEISQGFDMATAKKASFTLTGACDKLGDWSAINADLKGTDTEKQVANKFKTSIVWSAKKHVDVVDAAPSITDQSTDYTYVAGNDVVIKYSLGGGALVSSGIEKVTCLSGTTSFDLAVNDNYTIDTANNEVSIKDATLSAWGTWRPDKFTLVFEGGETADFTIQ